MRKIYRQTLVSLTLAGVMTVPAAAQTLNNGTNNNTGTIILPSNSSSFNQQGFNLPTAPRATGQDIVRGSGGLSCQSAVGGNGPVLDMGVIGTNDMFDRDSTALYGRITVPLGKKPKRVDCSKLYDLEIERLKMELKLMRAGGFGGAFADPGGARQAIYHAEQNTAQPLTISGEKDAPEVKPLVIEGKPETKKEKDMPTQPDRVKIASLDNQIMGSVVTIPETNDSIPTQKVKPQTQVKEIDKSQKQPIKNSRPGAVPVVPNVSKPTSNTVYLATIGAPEHHAYNTAGKYKSQLGAFSTLENAMKAWTKYQGQLPSNISDFRASAEPLQRNGKTLYLLRVGPFDRPTSRKVCNSVKGGCFAVKS